MANWTSEQLSAIEYRGGAAIVSAAAGSGKTAVLVERILRLITDTENKMNADELAVVTFTNKAADELRQRLMQAVERRERESRSEYLREQLVRLEDADISTISSFCMSILREYSALAGLSPDFTVLEQSVLQVMQRSAMKAAMKRFYEDFSDEEKNCLFEFFADTNDSGIETAVESYYAYTRNLPDIEGWIDGQLTLYSEPPQTDALVSLGKAQIASALRELCEICEKMANTGASPEIDAFGQSYFNCASALARLGDICAATDSETVPLLTFSGGRLPGKKGVDTSEIKRLRAKAEALLENIKTLRELILTVNADCGGETALAFRALTRLMRVFEEEYNLLKRGANGVDFSDIEQLVLSLTRDDGLCKKIAQRYAAIIVDEFQDSNDVQYEIFRRISKNGENLFFVGDIKQSIYRFRGANPDVFSRLLASPEFTSLTMSRNFRSNRHVINAVNEIFCKTMSAERGGAEYDARAMLYEGATFYGDSDSSENNAAELVIVTCSGEWEYVAARIAAMLSDGFLVTEKDGTVRPCTYKDFAVLLRSDGSHGKLYRNALVEYGIPAAAKDDGEYTSLAEIDLVLNLLTIIDNPYNNTALTAVLMSPLYMLSAEDAAQIRLNCGGSLYSGVLKLQDKLKSAGRFLDDYRRYRKIASDASVSELLRAIYDDGAVISAMSLNYKGEQCIANMRQLLNYTDAFTQRGGGTLADFLVYIDKTKRLSKKLAPADIQSGTDVVTIMSIHASKGLEFPICFVCETDSPFNMRDMRTRALFDIELGAGLVKTDSERLALIETLPHKLIAEKIRATTVSECMRLLYVALTRAREKLIITAEGSLDKKSGELKSPTENSFLSWIYESEAKSIKKIVITDRAMFPQAEKVSLDEENAEADGELTERIRAELSRRYKYSRLTEIPAKFTATELGVEHKEDILTETTEKVSVFPRKPSFMLPERRLSGKKKGDAYHKVMELLDFSGAPAQEQLSALLVRGSLSQAEYDCVKAEEIQRFLDSSLCRRATNAEGLYREFPVFAEIPLSEIAPDLPDMTDDRPIVQGVADMFFVENGKIVLVDYKTNHNASAAQLIDTYRGQLGLYARILSETFGLPIGAAVLYSFELGEIVVI